MMRTSFSFARNWRSNSTQAPRGGELTIRFAIPIADYRTSQISVMSIEVPFAHRPIGVARKSQTSFNLLA